MPKLVWRNWSGSVECEPSRIAYPINLDEIVGIVEKSGRKGDLIRVAGSGHSFTPLVETDDILISLDKVKGIEEVDASRGLVTVRAGTKLKQLGKALFKHGLAMENLGDIDEQSIAGAISTGTHGTGINFGNLSTQVEGLTLVTGVGDVLKCSASNRASLFKAAQVSLGVLGIMSKLTLRVEPSYRLHYQARRELLSDCLNNLEDYKQNNRHFEFFCLPYSEWAQVKFANQTSQPAQKQRLWTTFNKLVIENGTFWLLSEACRFVPNLSQPVSRLCGRLINRIDEVNHSHRIFATPRLVRFEEMEYAIPAEHFVPALEEIRACIAQQQFQIHFPIECRFVKGDDIWLSPAYQRDSAYIAVHSYKGMPYHDYFKAIEEILLRYEGRPHWGKRHTLKAEQLAERYPKWHEFLELRAELDPQGLFLNDYLRTLFGIEAQ